MQAKRGSWTRAALVALLVAGAAAFLALAPVGDGASTFVSANLTVNVQGVLTQAAGAQNLDAATQRLPTINITQTFTNGTGPNQSTLLYAGSRTLAAAAETIDLTSSLKDDSGTTIDFSTVKVRAIVIFNTDTTSSHTLKVGGAAATQWAAFGTPANLGPFNATTDIAVIGAGGVWAISSPVDGFGVDATHKSLKVDPGANTIVYKLLLFGG